VSSSLFDPGGSVYLFVVNHRRTAFGVADTLG
jgi:hypothetical protein